MRIALVVCRARSLKAELQTCSSPVAPATGGIDRSCIVEFLGEARLGENDLPVCPCLFRSAPSRRDRARRAT